MKAVIGIMVGIFGIVSSPEVAGLLPEYAALAVQGVGLILAGLSKSPIMKKEEPKNATP